MTRIRASVLRAIASGLLLLGCSADSADSGGRGALVGPNPWVQGGQTGALMPACGLTPAARAGDSIPGGDSGIVIHTESCVAFAAAELQLEDEDGMPVAFDLEPLPGGAMLVRPRDPLPPGVYRLTIAGMEMESVVAEPPAALPMRLGSLTAVASSCVANVALSVDPLLLDYLPQLKLSVSVDGGAEQLWFDYGTLDVTDGSAQLSLRSCGEQLPCFSDGAHTLRVTGELAGELGTLEPVDVTVETNCQAAMLAASNPAGDAGGEGMECGVTPGQRGPAGDGALLGLGVLLGLLGLRRARRSSA